MDAVTSSPPQTQTDKSEPYGPVGPVTVGVFRVVCCSLFKRKKVYNHVVKSATEHYHEFNETQGFFNNLI